MWDEAINTFVNGDFLLGLFQLVMAVLVTIVNVILYPFGLLIKATIPSLDAGLTALAGYFDYAGTYMAWVLNAFAVPAVVVVMLVSYYTFSYGITIAAWTIKLVIRWKQAIW